MSTILLILAVATLMLLSGVQKHRLVWRPGEQRCRRCHRERRYCSCPQSSHRRARTHVT